MTETKAHPSLVQSVQESSADPWDTKQRTNLQATMNFIFEQVCHHSDNKVTTRHLKPTSLLEKIHAFDSVWLFHFCH